MNSCTGAVNGSDIVSYNIIIGEGKILLGFNKSIQLLETREIEPALNDLLLDAEKGDEVWIITPYATMNRLSSLKRTISGASSNGAKISFVVRDETDQVNPAKTHLKEAIDNGLKVYAFRRLHAKVYWFENTASIITSANLVDGSFESSTEIGLLIEAGKLHDEIREWIENVIKPGLRSLSTTNSRKVSTSKSKTIIASTFGFCIRCDTSINFNPDKPYCAKDYKSWSKYSNSEYEEKFCHKCGKATKSSLKKPICYKCYKAG